MSLPLIRMLMASAVNAREEVSARAPNAIFKRFGESTLDFSLFVFIHSREVYAVVLHELHTAIDREFREANIEMAYPQRDVNIRSISQSALPMISEVARARAA